MLTNEQKYRMELAKQNLENTNCFGTSMYIFDFLKEDIFIYASKLKNFLKQMNKTDKPQIGSLSVFKIVLEQKEFIYHTAIVTSINPINIYHRKNFEGIIEENIPLEKIVINKDSYKIDYYN